MVFNRCSILVFWLCLSGMVLYGLNNRYKEGTTVLPVNEHGPLPPLSFNQTWQLLGPFQIGTREAAWGADPLEYEGGFHGLEYNSEATYISSLATGGVVGWSTIHVEPAIASTPSATVTLNVGFDDIDWPFLKSVYGWPALQFQAWVRGEIVVFAEQARDVVLYTDHVLEFWVDGKRYFGGDFYAYRKAPVVLHLEPGVYRIDLRLIRDVRAMGGLEQPTINAVLEARFAAEPLEVATNGILLSDIIDGQFVSAVGSIALRNNDQREIEIHLLRARDGTASVVLFEENGPTVFAPGQSKPLRFEIMLLDPNAQAIGFEVTYKLRGSDDSLKLMFSQEVTRRSLHDVQKVTHVHPGGIVSYSILRPPARNAACETSGDGLPVLLQLHGAGLEADSDLVAHALDSLPNLCAWVLFPTGVTPWSGDDWHAWGFLDVEAAILSIPRWIETNSWHGPAVDVERWLVSGHSNGGQGAWYALTHRPDNVIAAAPVSGFLSIETYVPSTLWQPMDPRQHSIIQAAQNSYRAEMLAENCRGIPILQQHGSKDDNVPAFHSRLIRGLLHTANWTSEYSELAGKGHWFDGVMTTDPLRQFYQSHLERSHSLSGDLTKWSVIVANPGDTESKGGIKVTQLEIPGQYGVMDIEVEQLDASTCLYNIKTSNILSFSLSSRDCSAVRVGIDGHSLWGELFSLEDRNPVEFWKTPEGSWRQWESESSSIGIGLRRGRQLGSLDAILRTNGSFIISYHGEESADVALQVSRNLFQYYGADSSIRKGGLAPTPPGGNLITIAMGKVLPEGMMASFPIHIPWDGTLSIRVGKDTQKKYEIETGLSAAFLRPLEGEALELVIWGYQAEDLETASRLLPLLTGAGQPDFAVLSRRCRWEGVKGAVAMGFFDHNWDVTKSSFFK